MAKIFSQKYSMQNFAFLFAVLPTTMNWQIVWSEIILCNRIAGAFSAGVCQKLIELNYGKRMCYLQRNRVFWLREAVKVRLISVGTSCCRPTAFVDTVLRNLGVENTIYERLTS